MYNVCVISNKTKSIIVRFIFFDSFITAIMNTNSVKLHQVMPEINSYKDVDLLKLCKENASRSFTKKYSQKPSGFFEPSKIL